MIMNDIDHIIDRYRQLSPILNPAQRNARNGIFNESSITDLRSKITEIEGVPDHPGKYYKNDRDGYVISLLEARRNDLKAVEAEFDNYCQMEVNTGNKPPTEWPPELQKKKDDTTARIMVHEEELNWLKDKLEKALELEKLLDPERKSGPLKNRKLWGTAKLRDGILYTIAGQRCSVNKAGVLCISEESSPYNGMPVWKFKSLIANPMFAEYRHRERMEAKAAKEENRDRKQVPFPPAPIINKRTKAIEYLEYSNTVIRKIKDIDTD